jgi:nicotinate-nucleotide pyrophosphorylase (carboxylating)
MKPATRIADKAALASLLPSPEALHALIETWLAEDIGRGDITTEIMIPSGATAEFAMVARHDMVVCGIGLAAEVFRHHVPGCTVEISRPDGARAKKGETIARVSGPARGLLTAERTALNLLSFLTGIATLTAAYAEKVKGTGATLVDTRKTIPGFRVLSKYATAVGGARNHRLALDDGVIIKDNHIAVHGSIEAAVARARLATPSLTKIEVECDTLDQVRQAVRAGADVIMLDNMDVATMKRAVALVKGRAEIEASGGITLETVRSKAQTGVDYISVGRITHSAPNADIGLDVEISSTARLRTRRPAPRTRGTTPRRRR